MARDGLLYAGLTLLLAWSLVTQIASAMPVGGDNQHLAWVLAWVAHAIASSPGSLLSGNIFFPAKWSLAFSDPNVSSGLLLAPIAYLGGSPAMLVNVLFFASFVLCGVAAGALCREWTGSALGGFAAGAVFAFSPIRFTHCDHVQLLAFWWTPIVLLGVDRFVRGGGPRPLLLALVALVAQAYASIYLAVFAAAATALLLVLRVAEREPGALRRSSIAAVVLAATGVMLCAPLVWAYADVRSTWGAARSLAQNVRYSASPLAYLSASPASLVWGRWLAGFADPTAPWEKYLFPGLAPIVLAGAALRGPRSFSVRLGLLLVAASVVASLGPSLVWHGADTGAPLPYRIAYDWLPPLRALRAPARWSLLASLGLSLAAGAGAARLAPRVAASLIVAAIVEAIVVPFPTSPVPLDPSSTDAYRALAGDRRPLLELPMARTEAERYELEPPRVYASTLHWRPIANGYSGYTPPTYVALADLAASLSPADLVGLLPTWEIRTVVLHLDQLAREQRGGWDALERGGLVRRIAEIGSMRVLELSAQVSVATRPSARTRVDGSLTPDSWRPIEIELAAEKPALLPPQTIGWRRTTVEWRAASGEVQRLGAKVFCPPAVYPHSPSNTSFVQTPSVGGTYRLTLDGECFDLVGDVSVGAANRGERAN